MSEVVVRPGPDRARWRRRSAVVAALGLLVLAAVLGRDGTTAPPLDPDSAQPDGLRGLLELLTAEGVSVEVSLERPIDMSTTAFVPIDRLGRARDAWEDWVRRGGRLVVADPASSLHGFEAVGGGVVDLVGPTTRSPACDGLDEVAAVTHAAWVGYAEPEAPTVSCFPLEDGVAWLRARAVGQGRVLALGSAAPFVNAALDEDDNAVLAAALLAPAAGDRLVVVPRAPVGAGEADLLDLVAPRVWHGLLLLGLAMLLAAVAVGRRLGRPVAEPLPPVLPASELAYSLGDLLQRGGRVEDAAAVLRRRARRHVGGTTGGALPPSVLVERAVERLGVPADIASAALVDHPVRDEDDLLAVHAAVERLLTRDGPAGT